MTPLSLIGTIKFTQVQYIITPDAPLILKGISLSGESSYIFQEDAGVRRNTNTQHALWDDFCERWKTFQEIVCFNNRKCISITVLHINKHFSRSNQYVWMYSQLKTSEQCVVFKKDQTEGKLPCQCYYCIIIGQWQQCDTKPSK